MNASGTTGIRCVIHGRRWLFDKSTLFDATNEKGNARKWRCRSPTRIDGEVTEITDPAGNATKYGYDADGREILMTDALGHSASKAYDADGELASSTDRDGQSINYAYDADGRETQEAVVGGDTLAWSYDADGEEVSASNAQGGYQFGYDADGRVTSVQEPFGLSLSFGYNADGNRVSVNDSLGGQTLSTYNADNQLLSEVFSEPGQPTLEVDQQYNADGEVTYQARTDVVGVGPQAPITTDDSYDLDGRMIAETYYGAGGSTISDYAYAYDADGELTQQTDHGLTSNFTYDADGELTGDGLNTNSYGANGNRTNTGDVTGPNNELLSDGTWNYSYDANGNETGKVNIATGAAWTYSYDAANHLVHVEERASAGGTLLQAIDYKYDVFGNRLEQDVTTYSGGTGTTVVTRFAYDGWNPVKPAPVGNENYDVWADLNASNNVQTRYLRGDAVDQLFGRIDADGNPYWSLTDRQGTIRDVVDNTGAVEDSIQYDAFGNIIGQTDASYAGRYAWTGREFDVETDLQYNHARYYNAATGRWMSQDPMGFDAGDSNLYRYVNNRPTDATDPSGREVFAYGQAAADKAVNVLENYGISAHVTKLIGRHFSSTLGSYTQGTHEIASLGLKGDSLYLVTAIPPVSWPSATGDGFKDNILDGASKWQKHTLVVYQDGKYHSYDDFDYNKYFGSSEYGADHLTIYVNNLRYYSKADVEKSSIKPDEFGVHNVGKYVKWVGGLGRVRIIENRIEHYNQLLRVLDLELKDVRLKDGKLIPIMDAARDVNRAKNAEALIVAPLGGSLLRQIQVLPAGVAPAAARAKAILPSPTILSSTVFNTLGLGLQGYLEFSRNAEEVELGRQTQAFVQEVAEAQHGALVRLREQSQEMLDYTFPQGQALPQGIAQVASPGRGGIYSYQKGKEQNGRIPVIIFNFDGPLHNVAGNIWHAQRAGHPSILRYAGDGLTMVRRRAAIAMVRNMAIQPGQTLDEYPFASTREGGESAWIGAVPKAENDLQGTYLRMFYASRLNSRPGAEFYVLVVNHP